MASLLLKAKEIEEKLNDDNDIDSIPLHERESIYSEIDKAVESNKLTIVDDTFDFKPQKTDIRFPVVLNISAFILIATLSTYFYFSFNKAETDIVTERVNIETAEGKLIEALVEESEEKLKAKDREILRIQNHLLSLKQQQDNLSLQMDMKSRQMEDKLRRSMADDFEMERDRLKKEGISKDQVIKKMTEYEKAKELEFNNTLNNLKKDLEEEKLSKEESLTSIIKEYESDLAAMSNTNKNIELLSKQQQEENLVRNQVLTSYNRIKDDIKDNNTFSAQERLKSLKTFINSKNIKNLPYIVKRKDLDSFLITTLEKLIEPDSKPKSEIAMEKIQKMVENGDELYRAGKEDEAKSIYIDAINSLPSIKNSFTKISDIENRNIENKWDSYNKFVKNGNRYYKAGNYSKSAEEYTKALETMNDKSNIPSSIVKKLIDSGIEIEKERSNAETRENNLARITALKKIYKKSSSSNDNNQDNIVSLLETKVQIKDILASDTVRSEYPNIHEQLQDYLDAYGREKERAGREDSIDMIININNAIKSDRINTLSNINNNSEVYRYLSGLEELF